MLVPAFLHRKSTGEALATSRYRLSGRGRSFAGVVVVCLALLGAEPGNILAQTGPTQPAAARSAMTQAQPGHAGEDAFCDASVIDVRCAKFAGGAKADSNGSHGDGTDNARALASALAAVPPGGTLFVPCTTGKAYRTTQPLSFDGKTGITIRGTDAQNCRIVYDGIGAATAAYTLVGGYMLTFEDISFSTTPSQPAAVVMLLGRRSGAGGNHSFRHFHLDGHATKALLYSVGSEENNYDDIDFVLRGGGAKYVFVTAQADFLGVGGGAAAGTNTSQWMRAFKLRNYSSVIPADAALIHEFVGTDSGDHSYKDGYGSAAGGSGIKFSMVKAIGNENLLSFEDLRFENLRRAAFYFTGPEASNCCAYYRVSARRINISSSPAYFMYGEDKSGIIASLVEDNGSISSPTSLYAIINSTIQEAYAPAITVRGEAVNSLIVQRNPKATLTVNRGVGSQVQQGGTLLSLPALKAGTTANLASGSTSLAGAEIGPQSCGAVVSTAAAGVDPKDVIQWSYASSPAGGLGLLTVHAFATAGSVNFMLCNPTGKAIKPSASVNWRVSR